MVIVSSHILPELADFCNSVGIIERGRMITHGRVADVVKGIQISKVLEAKFLDGAAEAGMFLHGKPHVTGTQLTAAGTLKIEFSGEAPDQAELLKALVDNGYRVVEFLEESADLEDVFLKVTTGAVN